MVSPSMAPRAYSWAIAAALALGACQVGDDAPSSTPDSSFSRPDAALGGDMGSADAQTSDASFAGEDGPEGETIVDRVLFFYTPHGMWPEHWQATGSERAFNTGPILTPLLPYRERLLILDGLDLTRGPSDSSTHGSGPAMLLTGISGSKVRTGAGDWGYYNGGGVSFDIWLGQQLTPPSGVSSVFTALRPLSSRHPETLISWAAADRPNDPLTPAQLMDGLFKADAPGIADLRQRAELADGDNTQSWNQALAVTFEILTQAFVRDRVRVATIQLLDMFSNARFPWIGVTAEGYHQMTHNGAHKEDLKKVGTWFAEQLAGFAATLDGIAASADSDESLLDHTLIVWISETGGTPTRHTFEDIPVILIGNLSGKLDTGRYLTFGDRKQTDLLATISHALGKDAKKIGTDTTQIIDELLVTPAP